MQNKYFKLIDNHKGIWFQGVIKTNCTTPTLTAIWAKRAQPALTVAYEHINVGELRREMYFNSLKSLQAIDARQAV